MAKKDCKNCGGSIDTQEDHYIRLEENNNPEQDHTKRFYFHQECFPSSEDN